MNDQRDTQRQNVMKAGPISFDGSGIDCLVRNMSVGGANLEVESQIGIPTTFDLVINVEHSNHHCHVVWRKGRRIGVAFDQGMSANEQTKWASRSRCRGLVSAEGLEPSTP